MPDQVNTETNTTGFKCGWDFDRVGRGRNCSEMWTRAEAQRWPCAGRAEKWGAPPALRETVWGLRSPALAPPPRPVHFGVQGKSERGRGPQHLSTAAAGAAVARAGRGRPRQPGADPPRPVS